MVELEPVVLGYSEAAMFLRGPRGAGVVGILSIHGAREHGVEFQIHDRLDLEFDDVEVPDGSDQMAMLRTSSRRRWAEQNGLREVAPNPSHAAAIIHFAERMRGKQGILLCHRRRRHHASHRHRRHPQHHRRHI